MRFSFIVCMVILLKFNLISQELTTNPTSIKWLKIKTEHFKIIFPVGLDSVANRTINMLENNYLSVSKSLGKNPKPISIVLQNQNVTSNGFVTFIPRHSEFFITPPQDYTLLGTNNWLDLLAKHEFRHVVQQDKSISGVNKIIHAIFGNYGAGGLSHVVLPAWFWEGDAVGIETAHSDAGRGAIPSFSMLLRAQLIENAKPFSYSKAVGRSFKTNIPNHYVLGYYLTSYMKNYHGFDVWDKLIDQAFANPYPFSFSKNVKKVTGLSIDKTYNKAYLELKSQFSNAIENRKLYDENYLNHDFTKFYTDYEYPQFMRNGSVIALKSGLATIAQLVKLDNNNKEEKLLEIGYLNDGFTLSAQNDKVIWAEIIPDIRWGAKEYSVLKLFDLQNRKTIEYKTKSRLAAPALSPSCKNIAAINTSETGKYSLQILDAETGNIKNEFSTQNNNFYLHPSWANDSEIVVVALQNNKKAIQLFDKNTGFIKNLLAFSNLNYAHPVIKDSLLIYNLAQNGIDNIFLYNINSKQNYQVTNAKFGAFNASFSENGKDIIFSDFTSLGNRITKMPLDFNSFLPANECIVEKANVFSDWMTKEENKPFEENKINKLEVNKYSKWNILNINSWGAVSKADGSSFSVGLNTEDLLSTTKSEIGIGFNALERQPNYFGSISYEGLFPVFDLVFENTGRGTIIPKGSFKGQTEDISDSWRQQSINLGIKLPFTYRHNKFTNKLTIASAIAHSEGIGYDISNRYSTEVGNKSIQSITNYGIFSRQKKYAKRDIGARWAQSAMIYFKTTPFAKNLQSNLFALQGSITIPGILKHDNIRFNANYIQNGTNNQYYFNSPVIFPRGFQYNIYDKMTTMAFDYKTPLADLDLSLGRLFYIQRINAGIFMDLGKGEFLDNKDLKQTRNYKSYGLDISSVFNFMRMNIPIEMGVRFNYLPNNKQQFVITPLLMNISF